MGEKRIQSRAEFFALPRHHVDRVVQKRGADVRRRFRHENAGVRLPPHQHRQCADVVLMRMRDQNGVERSVRDRLEVRQRILALVFRMHPAIEHEALIADLHVI